MRGPPGNLTGRAQAHKVRHVLRAGTATGFKFFAPTAEALLAAIERCNAAYRDPAVWRALQHNGMKRDFSWDAAAQEYAAIYARLVAGRQALIRG